MVRFWLDMRLSLHDLDEQDFNYFQRARLDDGRPLVKRDGRGDWHLWRLVPGEPLLLEATLTHLSEKQLRGLVGSLRVWLEGKFSPELPLQTLIDRQALPVELATAPPDVLDDNQLERLNDGAVVLHLLAEEGTVTAYARLKPMFNDGSLRWIRVGPLHAFDPMPLLLTLGLGVPGSPMFVSQNWLWFTAFVGANLLQSGFTRWCPLEIMLRKLGLRAG